MRGVGNDLPCGEWSKARASKVSTMPRRKRAEAHLLDSVQEYRSDDASTFPYSRQASKIDAPLLLKTLAPDDGHALGVAADL